MNHRLSPLRRNGAKASPKTDRSVAQDNDNNDVRDGGGSSRLSSYDRTTIWIGIAVSIALVLANLSRNNSILQTRTIIGGFSGSTVADNNHASFADPSFSSDLSSPDPDRATGDRASNEGLPAPESQTTEAGRRRIPRPKRPPPLVVSAAVAAKPWHLNLQSKNGTRVTLVHIGKTGGSALRDLIGYATGYCKTNYDYFNNPSAPLAEGSLFQNAHLHEKTTLQQHMCALARITDSRGNDDEDTDDRSSINYNNNNNNNNGHRRAIRDLRGKQGLERRPERGKNRRPQECRAKPRRSRAGLSGSLLRALAGPGVFRRHLPRAPAAAKRGEDPFSGNQQLSDRRLRGAPGRNPGGKLRPAAGPPARGLAVSLPARNDPLFRGGEGDAGSRQQGPEPDHRPGRQRRKRGEVDRGISRRHAGPGAAALGDPEGAGRPEQDQPPTADGGKPRSLRLLAVSRGNGATGWHHDGSANQGARGAGSPAEDEPMKKQCYCKKSTAPKHVSRSASATVCRIL
mmetsp:Transcript_101524/g.206117  ORF Transcript_101524/g.206117 Transcript_101524/m.206117 type:complete len:513 (+) Transcript_101524:179-1717(+)